MKILAKKYAGKLLPGVRTQNERKLREWTKLADTLMGIKILPGPGCSESEAQSGLVYPLTDVPKLPFPNCKRLPCCACCYSPVVRNLRR